MLKRFEELSRTIRNLHSVTDLLKSMGERILTAYLTLKTTFGAAIR